jgi:hypothetical protein
MSSKKESSLQAFAAILGILASVVALQDWYGKRAAGTEPSSASASVAAGVFHLRTAGGDKEPAAEPAIEVPAPEASAASAAPPAAAPANPAAAVPSAPAAAPVSAASPAPAAASARPAAPAPPVAAAASADPFMAMVNASGEARSGVAAAVRGDGGARLLSGLQEQHGVQLMRDFFRGGFSQSAYFDQLLRGEGDALRRLQALSGGRVLVGEMRPSYEDAEMGLVVCKLTFVYAVFNARGSRVAHGSVGAERPGDDRPSALSAAIEELLTIHGATLARAAGG